MPPSLDRIARKYDLALQGAEKRTLERVNATLEAAYRRAEKELLRAYQRQSENPSLLPNQRRLLVMDEVGSLLQLVNPQNRDRIQSDFENLLRGTASQGQSFADEMTQARANQKLQSFANVPLEAIRFQAQEGANRLQRHSEDFRNKASGIVEIGLTLGFGTRKVATELRRELGITKGKAETIARTEMLSSFNQATEANYQRNGITHVQWLTAAGDICPYCVGRSGNVYKLGAVKVPAHPRCKCYLLPFKPEWAELGLINGDFIQQHTDRAMAALEKTGKRPNTGVTPFEKAAGLTKPPAPYSTPAQIRPTSLQNLMRVGRDRMAALGDNPTLTQMQALRSELLKGLPQQAAIDLANESGLTPEVRDVTSEDFLASTLAEFHQLTAGNVKQDLAFVQTGDRAWADPSDRSINVGKAPTKENLFHELGHFLEADNPELAKAAAQWRDAKATGESKPLNELLGVDGYDSDERAVPGRFVSPYVGKVYESGLTEVVSVGMEHFASAEDMERLRRRDPDHFAFILGTLDAARSQRLGKQATAEDAGKVNQPLFMDWYDNHRPLTPVEEEMARSQAKRAAQFQKYLDEEAESIRRRTSGEIDRKLREYYDDEAAQIRKRLGIPEPQASAPKPTAPAQSETKTTVKASSSDALQIKSYNRALKPVKVPDLDGVDESSLTPNGTIALRVARDYQQVLREINEAIGKIPADNKTLPSDAYERIYGTVGKLFDRLTGLVNESKNMLGKSGNDVLEAQLGKIARISKENLPGYEIKPVTPDIVSKAALRPC